MGQLWGVIKEGWVIDEKCWNKIGIILTNELTMMNKIGPTFENAENWLVNVRTKSLAALDVVGPMNKYYFGPTLKSLMENHPNSKIFKVNSMSSAGKLIFVQIE